MQRVNRLPPRWRSAVFFGVALCVVLADQFSKSWIRANLARGEALFDIGFFRIFHVQNTGVAFGLFKDHAAVFISFAIIGIIVILLLVFVVRRYWSFIHNMLVLIALGMIMGGMIGNNLIDRVRQGYVTDFLDFKIWPVFNIADASGVIGVILVAVSLIFLYRPSAGQE